MKYAKPIMKLTELVEMGFPEEFLRCAYRRPGQTMAWKNNPYKRNSPIVFDTEALEKYRLQQCKLR